MRVSVSRTISAAHQLAGTLLHGHTYHITAFVDMPVDPLTGMAIAFADLKACLLTNTNRFDHDRLERTIGVMPATAENLAVGIARSCSKQLGHIVNVRVQVGDDGSVETSMQREDGEYFDR